MKVTRIIGGAGTGKTRTIIAALEKAMSLPEVGRNPYVLGFSSFTRAARGEAAERAANAWGIDKNTLEKHGWFKTVHSVAYRQIGVESGQVITSKKDDMEWLSNALGSDIGLKIDDSNELGMYLGDDVAAKALNYWSTARSMMVPLREIVDRDPEVGYAEVLQRVELYERAKLLESRIDFTDMLSRFAGVAYEPDGGPIIVSPEGSVPNEVVGWMFDEAQDASALIDRACKRLVTGEACQWCYLVGDPFQVLYGWSGANSKYFMAWDAEQRVMPKSYRCAKPILDLGERCIERMPKGYWNREIQSADHSGSVEESDDIDDNLSSLNPADEWLVLARTNYLLRGIEIKLREAGVPFKSLKAKESRTIKDLGRAGLWKLQRGSVITGEEWSGVLDVLPSKAVGGDTLLERGTKSQWKNGKSEDYDAVTLDDLPQLGATYRMREIVASGGWPAFVEGGDSFYRSASKWGVDLVAEPKIRTGTIHSAKGKEADNVLLLTSMGKRFSDAANENEETRCEECRVNYVAVTRARRRLVLADDPRERKYRMDIY